MNGTFLAFFAHSSANKELLCSAKGQVVRALHEHLGIRTHLFIRRMCIGFFFSDFQSLLYFSFFKNIVDETKMIFYHKMFFIIVILTVKTSNPSNYEWILRHYIRVHRRNNKWNSFPVSEFPLSFFDGRGPFH